MGWHPIFLATGEQRFCLRDLRAQRTCLSSGREAEAASSRGALRSTQCQRGVIASQISERPQSGVDPSFSWVSWSAAVGHKRVLPTVRFRRPFLRPPSDAANAPARSFGDRGARQFRYEQRVQAVGRRPYRALDDVALSPPQPAGYSSGRVRATCRADGTSQRPRRPPSSPRSSDSS